MCTDVVLPCQQLALVLALGFSIAMLLVDSVLVILRLTRAK